MKAYPVECLLRPAIELNSFLVALLLASVCFYSPSTLFFTPGVTSYVAASILLAVAALKLKDAYRILSYQKSLTRLSRYSLKSSEIPVSKYSLFLGRGFKWDQRHTQRLMDARQPENREYIEQSVWFRMSRQLERRLEHSNALFRLLGKALAADVSFNPVRPLPPVGGTSILHGVGMWEPEDEVRMDLRERPGHMIVLGTTRVGKTRLAEILIEQDIKRGDITIVFDPKGDAGLMRRVYATAKTNNRPIYVFHLGYPELSARYNSVGEFNRITEVATRVTNPLSESGSGAQFKAFGWRFVNSIAMAIYALGRKPSYDQIQRYINNIEPLLAEYAPYYLNKIKKREWAAQVNQIFRDLDDRNLTFAEKSKANRELVAMVRFIRQENIYEPVLEGLVSAFSYDKTYFDKIVSSIGPLMEKLTTGKTIELLAPNYEDLEDTRPILDWRKIIREKACVYVGLDALSDPVVASAVGNSMFSDLTSVAGELYKHGRSRGMPQSHNDDEPSINLHADEFNELIGDEFIPMLNKAGGAKFQVTAYTQTWSDVQARLGDISKAGQTAGNLNTMVMLRVKEKATAEMLTDQLSKVRVHSITSVSGVNDGADPDSETDFTSRNEDRLTTETVPMLEPADLQQLPKGQAFALIEGTLYKLRLPLPDDSEFELPPGIEAMARDMEARYSSTENILTRQILDSEAA